MESNEYIAVTVRNNLSYVLRRKGQTLAYRFLGAKIMAKIYYRIVMKEKLNLRYLFLHISSFSENHKTYFEQY